jgi:ComF family protein
MFEAPWKLVNRDGAFAATLDHLVSILARLTVPGVCGLCGGEGQWHRCRFGLDLCEHCEAALPQANMGAGAAFFTPFEYRPPVDFMIRQLKFGGDRSFARTLGILLAEARLACGEPLPDLIVPVPLHFDRLRERGYNQAAELALFAGRHLRIPVRPRALLRTRATKAQSGLRAADRAANVQGCFAVPAAEAARFRGKRVALIDDVLTTGSTAREAAHVLESAGATIEIWAASRAGRQPTPP